MFDECRIWIVVLSSQFWVQKWHSCLVVTSTKTQSSICVSLSVHSIKAVVYYRDRMKSPKHRTRTGLSTVEITISTLDSFTHIGHFILYRWYRQHLKKYASLSDIICPPKSSMVVICNWSLSRCATFRCDNRSYLSFPLSWNSSSAITHFCSSPWFQFSIPSTYHVDFACSVSALRDHHFIEGVPRHTLHISGMSG